MGGGDLHRFLPEVVGGGVTLRLPVRHLVRHQGEGHHRPVHLNNSDVWFAGVLLIPGVGPDAPLPGEGVQNGLLVPFGAVQQHEADKAPLVLFLRLVVLLQGNPLGLLALLFLVEHVVEQSHFLILLTLWLYSP